jgi:serine/threonine protein kinase
VSQGYCNGVDWWAMGILLFELLAGYPPFYDSSPYKIYQKIIEGHYDFPKHLSSNARKLISELLEANVEKRLGCSLVNIFQNLCKYRTEQPR